MNSLRLVLPSTDVLPLPYNLARLSMTESDLLLPTKSGPSDPIKPLRQLLARKAISDPNLKL